VFWPEGGPQVSLRPVNQNLLWSSRTSCSSMTMISIPIHLLAISARIPVVEFGKSGD
jgi:hypothetical protein